jgi:hypothetical protein
MSKQVLHWALYSWAADWVPFKVGSPVTILLPATSTFTLVVDTEDLKSLERKLWVHLSSFWSSSFEFEYTTVGFRLALPKAPM